MITKIKINSREDFLRERKKSLGGSDMGAVLGMNNYSSPMSVWMDKTGKSPDKEESEWMRLGNDLEDYVASRFSEKSGLKVINDRQTWRNDKYPYLHANIDRRIVGQKSGVECKVTSQLNEKKYRDGNFLDSYYAQTVEYLCVTEFERWYLAVLILGVGLRIYQMTRIPNDVCPEWCESSVYVDDNEINALAKAGEAFWKYVETNTPPPADGHPATSNAITMLYPESNQNRTVDLFGYEDCLTQYMALKTQIDELTKLREEMANRVKLYMGDSAKAEGNRYKVSWAAQTRSSFDRKAFEKDFGDIDLAPYFKITSSRVFKVSER